MSQIFAFLAILANAALLVTIWLGWSIENAASLSDVARQQVSHHFLFALATGFGVLFVHAIVLTYFMGTGRWIQETSEAYRFEETARKQNIKLKYRVIPGMMMCFLLVIVTGAFGAIADPASNTQMESGVVIHFTLALTTLLTNIVVNSLQYSAIRDNSKIVDLVYQEVLKVRRERGLEKSPEVASLPASE